MFMKLKKESDGKVSTNVKNSLTSFHDSLVKFNFPSATLLSQEQISYVFSLVKLCYKSQMEPILDLALR